MGAPRMKITLMNGPRATVLTSAPRATALPVQ